MAEAVRMWVLYGDPIQLHFGLGIWLMDHGFSLMSFLVFSQKSGKTSINTGKICLMVV